MSRHDDLLRKGKIQALKEEIKEREVQLRAKFESISLALNEYLVDSLAEVNVEKAYILAKDTLNLHAEYLRLLAQLKELEG